MTTSRTREKLVDSREKTILKLFGGLNGRKQVVSQKLLEPFEKIATWPVTENERLRVKRMVMQAFMTLRQGDYPSQDLTQALRILVQKWPLTSVDVYLNNLFISMKLNTPGLEMLLSDAILKGFFASHILLPSLAKIQSPYRLVPLGSTRLMKYYMSTTVLLAFVIYRTLDIFPTDNVKEREARQREELNSHFLAAIDVHLNGNFYFFLSLIYLIMGTGFWKIYLPYPDPTDSTGTRLLQPPAEYILDENALTKLTGILNYLVRKRNTVNPDVEKFVHMKIEEGFSGATTYEINSICYVHVNSGFTHQYNALEHFYQAQSSLRSCLVHFCFRSLPIDTGDKKVVDLTVYDFQPLVTNKSPIPMTMRFAWLYNLCGMSGQIFHGPGQDLRESVLFAGSDPHHHFRLQSDSNYMENYLSQWLHQFLVEKIWLQMLDMPSMFAPYFFGPLPVAEVRPLQRDFAVPSKGGFACV